MIVKGNIQANNGTFSGTITSTATISGGEISGTKISNGNDTFRVDENGNMTAYNATIYGNLYGLNSLKLYNSVKNNHRTVIELQNGDAPDSSKFVFKKPISGIFLVADEQEGVYFTSHVSFQKEITSGENIILNGSADGQGIKAYGSDGDSHYIIGYGKSDRYTYVGMPANSSSKIHTSTRLRGNTVVLSSAGSVTTSDERLKNSFKPLDEFDKVYMDIDPCAFRYNNGTSGRFHFGAKAGNVKEAFEKHGYTMQDFGGFIQMTDNPENEDYCGIDDPMGLIYTEFTMWNTHMIQKLYKKIEEQQAKIGELEQTVRALQNK